MREAWGDSKKKDGQDNVKVKKKLTRSNAVQSQGSMIKQESRVTRIYKIQTRMMKGKSFPM